ncbi:MAG: PSD1 domain-containing protein, partial [Candidatus Solibacter usitatus]|nr:PSD1 domain-containing protein [Candidatus Solibacter usitatus]
MRPIALSVFIGSLLLQAQEKPTADQLEFFESKIRPVLAKNCYVCHGGGSKTAMGGFFLDTRTAIRKGGANGPAVVPGKINEGTLLAAIRHEGRRMPPTGKLPDAVIADFEKWIAMGAPDPRDGKAGEWKEVTVDIEKGRKYWAFQSPSKPAMPKLKNTKWSNQPVDMLLMAAMERKGLTPAADADKQTLLRRVSMDLTGLPPTPEEIAAFQSDKRPDAYARVVDRLLASERYGERWGRHWMDVARYAESVGRGRNYAMPFAWRYRDYVIDSFNKDKSYAQFIMEQIAGDLLPAENDAQRNEQLIGSAFLSLGSHDLIEQNPAVFRMDVIDEQIHATSKVFLGITVGCARCHDHKFDPIPTADYYAMAGIFRSTEMLSGLRRRPRDNVSYFDINLLAKLSMADEDRKKAWIQDPEKIAEWNSLVKELDAAREGKSPALAAMLKKGGAKKNKGVVPPAGQQVAVQQRLRAEVGRLLSEMDKFPLPKDLAMGAREGKAEDVEIHVKGDVKELGRLVPRGFVQVVSRPGDKGFDIGQKESGRLQLAKWMARPENPLTARVMANRIWMHLFGRGIVATVDNFGKMGEQPSNQQVLDYLAIRFVENNWSVKKT